MTTPEAFIAVNRFGLGAQPGELVKAAADPQGWTEAQLAGEPTIPKLLSPFPASREIIAEFRATRRAAKKSKDKTQLKTMRKSLRQGFTKEAAARTQGRRWRSYRGGRGRSIRRLGRSLSIGNREHLHPASAQLLL